MPSATTKTKKMLAAALALVLLAAGSSPDEKHLSIYSSVATYTVPVTDRMGREYVGLLEVLEPLGRISARVEGQHWKMRFNNADSDFVAGKTRAKVRGRDLDLTAPFLIENSRGLVPLSSLGSLLPRYLGNAISFHELAHRLFIGDVATQVTTQLDSSNPPRLVLNFTAPVNPTISTEPGKLRMVFTRDPLVAPGSISQPFDNPTITQATFSENNGAAEMAIASSAPLMASFSNNGRTITVTAALQGPPAAGGTANPEGSPAPSEKPTQSENQIPGETATPPATTGRRILAVVDPAHGGTERGAALTETLAEKNVTLGFARLVRHELERQGFAVILLRDGDETLTLDQRAGSTNSARPAIYISLHAASQGSGARVYTSLLSPQGPKQGPFHAWNTAQAPALPVSQNVAAVIVAEMQKREFPARALAASLRPLNNLLMPAVAVELAPGPNGVGDLPSANYQQKAAAAIADALASLRQRLEAQP